MTDAEMQEIRQELNSIRRKLDLILSIFPEQENRTPEAAG